MIRTLSYLMLILALTTFTACGGGDGANGTPTPGTEPENNEDDHHGERHEVAKRRLVTPQLPLHSSAKLRPVQKRYWISKSKAEKSTRCEPGSATSPARDHSNPSSTAKTATTTVTSIRQIQLPKAVPSGSKSKTHPES